MSPHGLIADYERWLDAHIETVAEGRRQKHRRLRESPFAFLRGAYPVWLVRNAGMTFGPHVLAVGDLHVDNFGTWRTAGGGRGWGVNDLDEAAPGPCGNDLVRLAASALVAEALLHGYRGRLTGAPEQPAAPAVPPDDHFWKTIDGLERADSVPRPVAAALRAAMPGAAAVIAAALVSLAAATLGAALLGRDLEEKRIRRPG
jgi:hypothetical protein